MQREGPPQGAGNAMKEKEKEKQSLKVVIVATERWASPWLNSW